MGDFIQLATYLEGDDESGLRKDVREALANKDLWDMACKHARLAVPADRTPRVWMCSGNPYGLLFDCIDGTVQLDYVLGKHPFFWPWFAQAPHLQGSGSDGVWPWCALLETLNLEDGEMLMIACRGPSRGLRFQWAWVLRYALLARIVWTETTLIAGDGKPAAWMYVCVVAGWCDELPFTATNGVVSEQAVEQNSVRS